MEPYGKNHQKNIIAIIPARYSSIRLPGKLLLSLNGKPLILHTLEQAKKAKFIDRAIVATDDERILRAVTGTGNEAMMTSAAHQSGSDRIAEVAAGMPEGAIIVNIQGDEPLISPAAIDLAIKALLLDERIPMATTCEPIDNISDILSPDVVKVVRDSDDFALYFSRSPIPFPRDAAKKYGSIAAALQNEPELTRGFRKHTGLYVYRREFLLEFTKLPQSRFEKIEMLEQLRALESGAKIKVLEAAESSIGVDTEEDFERLRRMMESMK